MDDDPEAAVAHLPAAAAAATKPLGATNKSATCVTLMSRLEGATLLELIEVTGWLPHTTRAALTGLRKRGYDIDRGKRDGVTCYRIKAVA